MAHIISHIFGVANINMVCNVCGILPKSAENRTENELFVPFWVQPIFLLARNSSANASSDALNEGQPKGLTIKCSQIKKCNYSGFKKWEGITCKSLCVN